MPSSHPLPARVITIVSGLPRSGTSMMMRMLEAGGMPVLCDGVREADVDNPRGYYEFEPAKRTRYDSTWLATAEGKVVKMVYKLLYDLPADYRYRVLFMRRNTREVLASQAKMLARSGESTTVSDDVMSRVFHNELEAVDAWLANQANFSVLHVQYDRILSDMKQEVGRVADFVGPLAQDAPLSQDAMYSVVDASLYRNRIPR